MKKYIFNRFYCIIAKLNNTPNLNCLWLGKHSQFQFHSIFIPCIISYSNSSILNLNLTPKQTYTKIEPNKLDTQKLQNPKLKPETTRDGTPQTKLNRYNLKNVRCTFPTPPPPHTHTHTHNKQNRRTSRFPPKQKPSKCR